MTVLDGERRERRRVLYAGSAQWATPVDGKLMLDDGRLIGLEQVQHLAPCRPSKIICVHTNFSSRIYEILGEAEPPKVPTFFQKPVSALNHHGGELILPKGCQFLNYEGELAAIIGRSMRNITPNEVWQGLAGFSVANDVSLHDFRDADMGGMLRVKGVDGFCPVGPGIVWGQDIRNAILRSYLNDALVQECAIKEMIFGIDYLIADLARHITLEPGDIILTGTPANSRPMADGDVVEVEVTGIGRLRNTVRVVPAPRALIGDQPHDNAGIRRVALGNDARLPRHLTRAELQSRSS